MGIGIIGCMGNMLKGLMSIWGMLGNELVYRELSQTMTIVYLVVNFVVGFAGIGAVFLFLWIGFRLAKSEDEGKRKEAKKQMLWAFIAVFAIVIFIVLWNTVIVGIMAETQTPPI